VRQALHEAAGGGPGAAEQGRGGSHRCPDDPGAGLARMRAGLRVRIVPRERRPLRMDPRALH